MPEVVVYAGPSAHGLPAPLRRAAGMRWLPPARRGDIDRLLEAAERAGTVVVCDGVFGGEPAVSHAELCRALDAGWQVWGVSSMGAIRAHELRFEGMRGHGWVHAQFARHADFTDDEMCLLHVPEPPWFPVSEALVNVRYALERRPPALGIPDAAASRVVHALRELWFGDRTEARIRRVMVEHAGIEPAAADTLLAWLRQHRVKTLDLADLLARRPWLDALTPPAPAR
jgi:hypothetical protein